MRRIVGDPGPLCTLLMLLRQYEWAIEADLAFYNHRRYTDRWRFDQYGVRLLTLREIWNYLRGHPITSKLSAALNGGQRVMSETEVLIADLFAATTGRLHPQHPVELAKVAEKREREAYLEVLRTERVAEKRAREARQRGEVIDVGR
ncbi:hypothetical protein NONO_c17890 [Nocardia nova SH22a]|uniref:Uncharacterized protein n=1 Tax=Nocardia nova SH22a TaxID=1415166 RepID=W5TBP5_9NOCA|nr:hypothetical protein [Nocardia nova]AHH16589.1 hypothetical protein NONO_c17890 [Nocardia nova SH22a]